MRICYTDIVPNLEQNYDKTACGIKPMQAVFLWQKKEVGYDAGKKKVCCGKGGDYWSFVGMVRATLISLQVVMTSLTETVGDRFSNIMRDFYVHIVAISTVIAVTVAAVALIVRMVSRNQSDRRGSNG